MIWILKKSRQLVSPELFQNYSAFLNQGELGKIEELFSPLIAAHDKKNNKESMYMMALLAALYEHAFTRYGKNNPHSLLSKAEQIGNEHDFIDVKFWVALCKLEALLYRGRTNKCQELEGVVNKLAKEIEGDMSIPFTFDILMLYKKMITGDFTGLRDKSKDLLGKIQQADDKNAEIEVLRFLGYVAFKTELFVEAHSYYEKAISYAKASGSIHLIPVLYSSGALYLAENKINEASNCFLDAQRVLSSKTAFTDSLYHIQLHRFKGIHAMQSQHFDEALHYFQNARAIIQSSDNPYEEGLLERETGRLYMQRGEKEKALIAFENAAAKFIIIDNTYALSKVRILQEQLQTKKVHSEKFDSEQKGEAPPQENVILDNFIKSVLSSLDINSILNTVIENIMKITDADRGFLVLVGEKGDLHSQVVRMKEKSSQSSEALLENFSRSIVKKVIEKKEAILLKDAQADERFAASVSVRALDIHSVICVPIKEDDQKLIGVIYIDKPAFVHTFTQDNLKLVELMAGYAAIALHNAQAHEGVQKRLQTTEAQLIQSEKLATIGMLAGGVAHEINNPLGAILINSELLKHELSSDASKEMIERIEEGTRRCKTIVEMLLQYARKTESKLETIDISMPIEKTLAFLGNQLQRDNIQVVKQFSQGTMIGGNCNELMQVFTNIFINAQEAIKSFRSSGTISVKTFKEGNSVTVEITDDGPGINPKDVERIFDPFFTTKDVGEGTGLGLSIVHRIIENHRGTIHVKSSPQQGASFILKFPAQ